MVEDSLGLALEEVKRIDNLVGGEGGVLVKLLGRAVSFDVLDKLLGYFVLLEHSVLLLSSQVLNRTELLLDGGCDALELSVVDFQL